MTEADLSAYFASVMKTLSLPPLHERFAGDSVLSDGIRIHLDILEKKAGVPTVVFIPGTAIYGLCYAEILCAIHDEGYNVISLDPRGHGRSGGRRGDYTIGEIVRDARAAIDYARGKFGPVVTIMGSSQGGIAALYTAAAVKGLSGAICHNIADLADPGSTALSRSPRLSRILRPLIPGLAAVMPLMPIPISLYLDLTKEKIRGFGNAWEFIRQDPLALRSIRLRALASLVSTPLPVPLETIATPILVLHSEYDNIFPTAYVEKIYNRLTSRKMMVNMKGLPHLITLEHVGDVMPYLSAWLSETAV